MLSETSMLVLFTKVLKKGFHKASAISADRNVHVRVFWSSDLKKKKNLNETKKKTNNNNH